MKKLICKLLLWHWLVRPLSYLRWHSDAQRFGKRCDWCGEFESHPWFSDCNVQTPPARSGKDEE